MTLSPSSSRTSSSQAPNKDGRAETTIEKILPLLGADACLLHPKAGYEGEAGGGDFDCAVDRLDEQWPLRAQGVRVCQCIRHGPTGWFWVVDDAGQPVAIDALDDPMGIGPIGFPTGLAFEYRQRSLRALRAAFVTLKRLRKGIRDIDKWVPFIEMARSDPAAYRECLTLSLGTSLGYEVARSVLAGRLPTPDAWRRAALALRIRRVRSPKRAGTLAVRSLTRLVERLLYPTGLVVAVVGPDGTGKSTLAPRLVDRCQAYFWRTRRFHWRPGILPRAGALVGSKGSDPNRPHDAAPHGRIVSTGVLLYYWLDFFVGSWLKLMPLRTRSTLIVVERGWWDIVVDPKRYRMQVPLGLVVALGRLLPRPDVTLVLEAPGPILVERKQELSTGEAERQMRAWRDIARKHLRYVRVDASLPITEVEQRASQSIISSLEERAAARIGLGWLALADQGAVRWNLPRGSRAVARNGLNVYQPVTFKARLGWQAARAIAGLGLFRLAHRGRAPHPAVRKALAPHIPPRGTFAVMKANHPSRFVALVLDGDGTACSVAKVAADEAGRVALRAEARSLVELAPLLSSPLRAPKILHHDERLLVLEAVSWRPRAEPWKLPIEVARALGCFFAAGASSSQMGPAHGDFAPWNLLETSRGWVAIDWESARSEAPPFYDLFHHIVQACALLGHPTQDEILRGLKDEAGHIGHSISAYAAAAGLTTKDAKEYFLQYIDLSRSDIDAATPDAVVGLRVRAELELRVGRQD